MIRFFLLNLFIVFHTIIFSIWAVIISIFDNKGRLIQAYSAVPWSKVILWVCGVRVDVAGGEKVDRSVPRIYASNHQSAFDIFTLLACLPVDFKFILKHELMKIPFLGFAMKRAKYISINRSDPREAIKSINNAAERIKNGASVLIFPEGTRSKDGRLQSFKRGGFHIALKSGCEIVPVSIIDSRKIIPKGSFRINRGAISMVIGDPISVESYSKKNMDQLMTRVRNAMIAQAEGGLKTVEEGC